MESDWQILLFHRHVCHPHILKSLASFSCKYNATVENCDEHRFKEIICNFFNLYGIKRLKLNLLFSLAPENWTLQIFDPPVCPHHQEKENKIKGFHFPPSPLDCVDNKDLIGDTGEKGLLLCGSGSRTSPLATVQTTSLGTECSGPSPRIARFWHHSRPYKARYRLRMPGIALSLSSNAKSGDEILQGFFTLYRHSMFLSLYPLTLTGSSVIDQASSVDCHRKTVCGASFIALWRIHIVRGQHIILT